MVISHSPPKLFPNQLVLLTLTTDYPGQNTINGSVPRSSGFSVGNATDDILTQ